MTDTVRMLLTLLGSVVLFYFLVLRRQLKVKRELKAASTTVWQGIRDEEKLEQCVAKLRATFGDPKPNFEMPADVEQILSREPDSEYGLNLFLQRVAAHCGYNRENVTLRINSPVKGKPPGQISKLGSLFLMELFLDCRAFPEGTKAVIVHEFCHFFLDCNQIALRQDLDNEILTDAAAVYLGFGKILREGYRPTFHMEGGKNAWHRIGYLDVFAIDRLIELIYG